MKKLMALALVLVPIGAWALGPPVADQVSVGAVTPVEIGTGGVSRLALVIINNDTAADLCCGGVSDLTAADNSACIAPGKNMAVNGYDPNGIPLAAATWYCISSSGTISADYMELRK